MGKLWQYLAGAVAFLAAVLWGQRQKNRRERAEEGQERAERSAESERRRTKLARDIEEARSEQRQEASDHAVQKESERRSGERPTGNVGDRLRDNK